VSRIESDAALGGEPHEAAVAAVTNMRTNKRTNLVIMNLGGW
jgi:hypothetical protein